MHKHSNSHQNRAGVAIVDISPERGIALGGYPHFPRHNTGIHDPLMAGCIVLDDDVTRVALVCMDLLFFSRRYVQAVRQRAEKSTGIPAANILICCSHTHSSPWGSDFFELGVPGDVIHPDDHYISMLQDKLVHLIVKASTNMFAARLSVEKGICGREHGVGGNRRDPNGPADPEVWTIGVQDSRKKWRACLVKYALHPTVIHEDSALVTADYPGYIRRCLNNLFPGMIMLFAQGTSGNQSSRYFRKGQSFDEAERIGTAIGRVAGEAMMHSKELIVQQVGRGIPAEPSDEISVCPEDSPYRSRTIKNALARKAQSCSNSINVPLGAWSGTVNLPLKVLPPRAEMETRVQKAREHYASLKAAGAPYLDVQNANLVMLGEEDTLACVLARERGDRLGFIEDELPAEVQVIGIGEARIVCLPGEIFVEFGHYIQKESPFPKTFVITCANGILPGYVCTAEAYAAGGYETGASLLTPEAGEILTNKALEILKVSRQ